MAEQNRVRFGRTKAEKTASRAEEDRAARRLDQLNASAMTDGPLAKRSVTIAGHRTSLSLEPEFWQVLKALARRDGRSLAATIAAIDEVPWRTEPLKRRQGSRAAGIDERQPALKSALAEGLPRRRLPGEYLDGRSLHVEQRLRLRHLPEPTRVVVAAAARKRAARRGSAEILRHRRLLLGHRDQCVDPTWALKNNG